MAATTSCHSKTRPWVARNRPVPSQNPNTSPLLQPRWRGKSWSQGVRKVFSSQARHFLGTLPRDGTSGQVTSPTWGQGCSYPPPPRAGGQDVKGSAAGGGEAGAPLLTLSALRVPGRGPQLQGVLELESSGCAERGAPTRRKWGLGGAELSNPQTPRAVHYLNTS